MIFEFDIEPQELYFKTLKAQSYFIFGITFLSKMLFIDYYILIMNLNVKNMFYICYLFKNHIQ